MGPPGAPFRLGSGAKCPSSPPLWAALPRSTQRLEPLYKSFTHKLALNEPQTMSNTALPGEQDDIIPPQVEKNLSLLQIVGPAQA